MKNGFNATFAAGTQDMKAAGRNDPDFQYLKLGYQASLNQQGPTSFAVDYGMYDEIAQNNDDADTFGLLKVDELFCWVPRTRKC